MATLIGFAGWEQGLGEMTYFYPVNANLPTISITNPRSGLRSLRYAQTSGQCPAGVVIPVTTELRAFTGINHNGMNPETAASDGSILFLLLLQDGTIKRAVFTAGNGLAHLLVGTSVLASSSFPVFAIESVYHEASIAYKAHASAGWFKLFIDGNEAVSFVGNTGASPVVAVACGGAYSSGYWLNYAYFDDLAVFDTAGEPAQAVPSRIFAYAAVDGNGAVNTFVGSDGNSTDNYLLVDEVDTHDENATYVQATAAAQEDLMTHAAITLPSGFLPVSIFPMIQAKKTDASIATTIQPKLYKAGSGAVLTAQALSTIYAPLVSVFTTLPDASPLTETNINLTQIGYVSAGAYS